jgi:hypothetical protein
MGLPRTAISPFRSHPLRLDSELLFDVWWLDLLIDLIVEINIKAIRQQDTDFL